MKIKCDEKELFELTETQKRCIQYEIPRSIFDEDMHRRLKYILMHLYEQCYNRMKKEWEPKLKAKRVRSIPLDEEEFCQLVFSQDDYMDREAREAQNKDV